MLDYRFVTSALLLDVPGAVSYYVHAGSMLHAQRNEIAENVRGEWLLFLDDDMVFPPDLLRRLLAHDKDIVGALAFRRVEPFLPCIARWDESSQSMVTIRDLAFGELMEVDGIGMGCTLIRKRVFEAIPRPYFSFRGSLSEDFSFCRAAAEHGFKIHCDAGLTVGHVSSVIVDASYYLTFQALGEDRR